MPMMTTKVSLFICIKMYFYFCSLLLMCELFYFTFTSFSGFFVGFKVLKFSFFHNHSHTTINLIFTLSILMHNKHDGGFLERFSTLILHTHSLI
jgi:hypothetical protein